MTARFSSDTDPCNDVRVIADPDGRWPIEDDGDPY
jgi:hypothetical protein